MINELSKIPHEIYGFLFGDLSLWGALKIMVFIIFAYMLINGKGIISRIIQLGIIILTIDMFKMHYQNNGLIDAVRSTIVMPLILFAPIIIKNLYKTIKPVVVSSYKHIKNKRTEQNYLHNFIKTLKSQENNNSELSIYLKNKNNPFNRDKKESDKITCFHNEGNEDNGLIDLTKNDIKKIDWDGSNRGGPKNDGI